MCTKEKSFVWIPLKGHQGQVRGSKRVDKGEPRENERHECNEKKERERASAVQQELYLPSLQRLNSDAWTRKRSESKSASTQPLKKGRGER